MTAPSGSGNWAILRQLVLATDDALAHGARITGELRLPVGFDDPQLADIGLADYVMPVGPQKYLEVVGPLDDSSYINRWLRKVGGAGGYCLLVQVPDAPACKQRAISLGVRLAADQVLMGHPLFQMHPADVGILLELDGISDPEIWFWDDITPGPRSDAVVDDIVSVTVGVPEPTATAAQWAHIIGLDLESPASLDFSGCAVDFVEHPVGQLLAAQLRLAPGATAPAVSNLLGLDVSFRSFEEAPGMTLHEELVAPAAQAFTNPYLEGPYEPVQDEVTAVDLPVLRGTLPDDIDGVYVRNGPNPQFAPIGRYHYFDGDGMLHAVHFDGGRATYRNRYVRTREFLTEKAEGGALWRGIIESFAKNPAGDRRERNAANTDALFHHGNLLATWYRASKPHALDPITLDARGEDDFRGTLTCEVSAHAKVDERTEQMMFFDYGINSPYLRYGVVDPAGAVVHFTGLELPAPRLPHDMAITENYSILMDLPLYNDPAAEAAGRFKLFFDRELRSRFAVLPRFGQGTEARWFEADPAYIYHVANAWEDASEIVMVVCRVTKPTPVTDHGHPLAQLLAYMRPEAQLHEYRFNLITGACTERPLDDVNTEFPAIHQAMTGHRARWSYNMRLKVDQTLLFDALMKYDVLTGTNEIHEFGPGNYGSEVVFIPRAGAVSEDDGYLSMYCYNSATGRSEVWLYSAQRVSDGPICVLGLPVRVPLGFHATWVSGDRMRAAAAPAQPGHPAAAN